MKVRSILGLMVSLAVLGAGSLPVLAQSQRYPTNAEIQQLMPEFRSQIALLTTFNRDPEHIRAAKTFAEAWSRVNRSITPFLGYWTAEDFKFSIFPSYIKNRVCIIEYNDSDASRSTASLTLGTVSNGHIRTWRGSLGQRIIIRQGDYLGVVEVYRNRPSILSVGLFGPPISLENPPGVREPFPEIIREFKAAGCTASRPSRR